MGGKHHIKCLACGRKKDDFPNLNFFKLPEDNSRRQIWLQSLERRDLIGVKLSHDLKVCANHFGNEVFLTTVQNNARLKWNAIPGPEPNIRILDNLIIFPNVIEAEGAEIAAISNEGLMGEVLGTSTA